jgi:predicted DsbA family dithiol-disulfide isomerase
MIKVEIWSDLNCPFCYIGKRHLESALEKFSKRKMVVIEWKSFELDPTAAPKKGEDNTERLAKKYGRTREWAEQMNRDMTAMAKEAGLIFHMNKVIAANSFDAHRMLHLAKTKGIQNELKEILFSYKFCEGKDIASHECLRIAAQSIGIELDEIQAVLESDKFYNEVRRDEDQARALGIHGVPYFRFNKEHSISGARPPEVFLQTLEECARFEVSKELF